MPRAIIGLAIGAAVIFALTGCARRTNTAAYIKCSNGFEWTNAEISREGDLWRIVDNPSGVVSLVPVEDCYVEFAS